MRRDDDATSKQHDNKIPWHRTPTMPYSTRHLEVELRNRLTLVAVTYGLSMEQLINKALRIGLDALERGDNSNNSNNNNGGDSNED